MNSNSKRGILLTGSYNGQDSMGDKCLLRVVSARFRRLLADEVSIYFHATSTDELQPSEVLGDTPVTAHRSIQPYFWNWHLKHRLQHLGLPQKWRDRFSEATFPLASKTVYRNDKDLQEALRQLHNSAFMFMFGGTQLTKQWWRKNFLPYRLMARIADLPVYFGTQQYGPMSDKQQEHTQAFIRERVQGIRFRNTACMPELGMGGKTEKLTRDEVFSNTQVYPLVEKRSGQKTSKKNILVNFRGKQNFLTDNNERTRIDNLVAYLRKIHDRLDCSFTFFSVSGPDFCDDTESIPYVRENLPGIEVRELPYTNAYDHIEAAKKAYAAVSMSFHGVILSMIGGCPAIPVTHGKYYNHKYIGFEDYNPDTPIPIFHVNSNADKSFIEKTIDYFKTYDPSAVSNERRKHNEKIESFYQSVLANHGVLKEQSKKAGAEHG